VKEDYDEQFEFEIIGSAIGRQKSGSLRTEKNKMMRFDTKSVMQVRDDDLANGFVV
jgi:hypothetical protein